MSHADSGAKYSNAMTILYRMQNLYANKKRVTKMVIDNFSQSQLSLI